MMTSMTQFAAVNPAISLAAMHARMVVFAQDEQGHQSMSTGRAAARPATADAWPVAKR
jgi:hypothetical protein